MIVTIYNSENGKISHVFQGRNVPDQVLEGQSYVLGAYDGRTKYIDDFSVTDRPTLNLSATKTEIAADNSDTAQISGVPTGASIYRNGEYIGAAAADGLINVKSDTPKKIGILVDLFPYRPEEVVIHAS